MYKKIIKLAEKKFSELQKKYRKFFNVIVDDWRGFRFVYDTQDVRNCSNDCKNCDLYNLLKNEKDGFFSAGLYQASKKDQQLFGKKVFLNCKTLDQYKKCYSNFLIQETKSDQEIVDELNLIKNFKIIYSKLNTANEKDIKISILNKAINSSKGRKKRIIKDFLDNYAW